ncbi:MAG: hypothetical protein BGO37_10485 [Cellulomonas sp. 73-92]|nr:MAG: hypothetical protein BGO37_10485 [Cellulomonas sp. 73-92]
MCVSISIRFAIATRSRGRERSVSQAASEPAGTPSDSANSFWPISTWSRALRKWSPSDQLGIT